MAAPFGTFVPPGRAVILSFGIGMSVQPYEDDNLTHQICLLICEKG